MPRGKQPPAPETRSTEDSQLALAVDALTKQVRSLVDQVEILRIAIDDLRQEVEWAIRNTFQPAWPPAPPLTSVPQDALAPDLGERVNRVTLHDLPSETPAKPSVVPSPMPVEQGELWS